MKSAPTKLYHLEGVVRPYAVRWLTGRSIIVCRTSGTLELQPDYDSSASHLYRTGSGICRLYPIPGASSVFVLGDGKYEVICNNEQGLTMSSGILPANLSFVGACVIPRFGLYVLASRDGFLWISSDGVSWSTVGKLSIQDVTVGCAFSECLYAFGSAHGEVELITLFPFLAKTRQRLHADAVQDLLVLDQDTVGTVSRDRALRVWRISNKFELLWSISNLHEHFVNCAVRVGDEIWTGSSDGTIAITSLSARAKVSSFKVHVDAVRTLDLTQDRMKILSLSDDATYKIYDTQSKIVLKQHGEERQYVRSGDFLFQDGSVRTVFGSTSGFLYYGKVGTESFSKVKISKFSLRAMRHISDTQIICGDETGVLWLFDMVVEQASVSSPTGAGLTAIRINTYDQTVICGYRDGFVRVFSNSKVTMPCEQKPLLSSSAEPEHDPAPDLFFEKVPLIASRSRQIHESIVGDLLPLPNGLMISCSDDHTIKTTILDSLSILKITSLDSTAINNLLIVSDLLVATTDGGIVFVLDVITHEIYRRYTEHTSPVRSISNISDSLVATGDRLGEVRIWNVKTCKTLSVNKFRERVIELGYDFNSQRLYVITESEVASLQLDREWFLFSDGQDISAEQNETSEILGVQLRKAPVELLQKQGFDDLIERPFLIPDAIQELNDIEITKKGKLFQLNITESNILRRFIKWQKGTRCDLGLLSGGLSDARVFSVRVFDQVGTKRINAVAKIGSRTAIQTEAERYDTEISRLSPSATPRRLGPLEFSDEGTTGVFYGLAEGYDSSEFQIAIESQKTVTKIVDHIKRLTTPWSYHVPENRTTIGDIRRRILPDSKLREIKTTYSLDWVDEFERRTVQVRWCTIHGDLHGGNILVDQHGSATIIDYGNIGIGPAPFDPVTLEFSHLFHPNGPFRHSEWPRTTQARRWKTEEYLVDSPMLDISQACWRWAEDVCAGHREIAAAAYTYLILQLKYSDTNKERILDLLIGVRAFYDNT